MITTKTNETKQLQEVAQSLTESTDSIEGKAACDREKEVKRNEQLKGKQKEKHRMVEK